MLKTIQKEWQAKVAIIFFLLYTFWWLWIQTLPDKNTNPIIHLFAGTYGIIALWGAYWGLKTTKQWGFTKSLIGRAILMFSLGLLFQEFGQLAYAFYIVVLKIEVPYPSIGDVGFFGSIFFYIYGIYLFAKASGIHVSLKEIKNKLQAITIPILMLAYSYFLFLRDYSFDWSKPLTIFLDLGYPLGQTFYIALALLTFLLTRKLLGGIMKSKVIFILFALLLQYLADFNFLFQSSRETWTTAGYGDYLYFVAYLFMTIGLLQLMTVLKQIKEL